MMKGPTKIVAVVRKTNGELTEKDFSEGTSRFSKVKKIPIVRGVFALVESFSLGYKTLDYSAEVSTEGLEAEAESKLDKWINEKFGDKLLKFLMPIAAVLGVGLAVLLFFWFPAFLFSIIPGLSTANMSGIWRSVFEGIFRLILLVAYMALISLIPDIKRVFQYHGAEHKTIFCYESGEELTVENVRKQSRFHPRCGTSFIILMVLIGILLGFFITTPNALIRMAIRLIMLPLTCGIGYEIIKLCGKYDNILTCIIAKPGLWVQRITTKEPEDGMIEVAIAALEKVIPEQGEDILK